MEEIVASNQKKNEGNEKRMDNEPVKPLKRKRVKYNDQDRIVDKHFMNSSTTSHVRTNVNNLVSYGDIDFGSADGDFNVKASLQENLEVHGKTKRKQSNVSRKNNNRRKKHKDSAENKKQGKKTRNKSKGKIAKIKQSKIVQCKFYLEGKCVRGTECTFSHAAQPLPKKEVCKFYVFGFCTKGKNCLYMHEEFPCKFFHTGAKCYSEPNCRFSHAPLTEESKGILMRYLDETKAQDIENGGNSQEVSLHNGQPTFNPASSRLNETEETVQKEVQQQHPEALNPHSSPQDTPILNPPPLLHYQNFYTDILGQSATRNPSLTTSVTPENQARISSNSTSPSVKVPGVCSRSEKDNTYRQENNGDVHQKDMAKAPKNNIPIKECTASRPISNSTEQESTGDLFMTSEADFLKDKKVTTFDVISDLRQTNNQETTMIPTPFTPKQLYSRNQQCKVYESSNHTFKNSDKEWHQNNIRVGDGQRVCAAPKNWRQTPSTSQQSLASPTLSSSRIDIAKILAEIRQRVIKKPSSKENNATNQPKAFWKNLLAGALATVKDADSSTEYCLQKSEKDLSSRSDILSNYPTGSISPSPSSQQSQSNPPLLSTNPHVSSANSLSDASVQLSLPLSVGHYKSTVMDKHVLTKEKAIIAESTIVPYKLHFITASPPNYSSVVLADRACSKLSNDPRLRKYFKQLKTAVSSQHFKTQLEGHQKDAADEDHVSLEEFWDWLRTPGTVSPKVSDNPSLALLDKLPMQRPGISYVQHPLERISTNVKSVI